jgi:iron complex outermembrane receptor protein
MRRAVTVDAVGSLSSSSVIADNTSVMFITCRSGMRLALRVALSLGVCCSAELHAQGQSDQDVLSLSIEDLAQAKVFTASRHAEKSQEAPSSVSVITADDIKKYGWRTLGDALSSLRGFYTSYDRDYEYLGVRGFMRPGDYNSRILLMINGHRMNDNVYGSAFIGTDFPLDLDLIERIEVVRGPGSSLYGTNSVFGVINVITRQPTSGTTVEASGDTSSFEGRTGRVSATVQKYGLNGTFSGSLYRSAGQSQLFYSPYDSPANNNGVAEDGDGDRYAHAFADVQYGNFRVEGLFGTRTKLVPTGSYESNFNDSANRTTDSRAFVEASYHRDLSLGELDTRVFFDWYDFFSINPYGGSGAGRYLVADEGLADWVGTETTLGRQIGKNRVIVGADYEYSMKVEQTNDTVGQPPSFVDRRQPWQAAIFGEFAWNLVPKLTLRMGGRSDWFDQYGNSLSPRIAAVYSATSRTTLKYIYGRAFSAPSAYQSYYSDGVSIDAPTTKLKPETMGSQEVVLERVLASWLQMSVDGSYNRLKRLIDQEPDPATGLTQFVNNGRDQGRTVELEFEAKRASGLAARASYTLSDAAEQNNLQLANSPWHMAKFDGTLPLSRRSFAAVELLYASSQQSYQGTNVPPSFLTNLTLSTKPLWGGWEFSTSCYNAFNRLWYSPAGPGLLQPEIQQDGRTFRFKISYRLRSQGSK